MDRETAEWMKRYFGTKAEGRVFVEERSLPRMSYAEIDRRFRALETDVSDLRARVERLESRGA